MKNKHYLIALLGYSFITALFFYPVLSDPFTLVIGDKDSFYFLWDIWLFKGKIIDNFSNSLNTDTIFYPFKGVHVPWSSPINEIFGSFLCLILGSPLTFNIITVGSFPLAGLFFFMYLRRITGDFSSSFIGGFMYSFSPYHFIHANQIGLTTIQWIPLFLIAVDKYIEKPRTRECLWLLIAAWIVALSDPYTFFYFLLFFLIFLAFSHFRASVMVLLSLPVMTAPFYVPMAEALSSIQGAADLSVEAITYSQDLLKYVIPWKFHPLWGSFFRDFFHGDELIEMFMGYIPFFLSVVAVKKGWKKSGRVMFWLLFGSIALVLSLGPYLKVNGSTGIPAPYWLLWKVPLLSYLRMPQRFGLEVSMALSALTALGVKETMSYVKKGTGARSILASVVLLGIGLEYVVFFPFPVSSAHVPRIYSLLKKSPRAGAGALLELPLGDENDTYRYMFYQVEHGLKLVNGALPRDPDWAHNFQEDAPFLQQLGDPLGLLQGDITPWVSPAAGISALAGYLKENGVSVLVIHSQAYSGTGIENALREVMGTPFFEDAEVIGFKVGHTSPSPWPERGKIQPQADAPRAQKGPIIVLGRGWYGLRHTGGTVFRWMRERGEVKAIGNPEMRRVRFRISFVREFPRAKTLRVFVNEKNHEDIDISTIPYSGSVTTTPFLLPPGDSRLSLSVAEGAFNPFEEKGVPDPRRISIGITDIEILYR